jgi:hypothetical protein
MAAAEDQIGIQEATFEWLQIVSGVAQGLLAPEEGITMLQALAEAHPADRDWLLEEAETIRRQFGLDVADRIRAGEGGYWDKLLSVVEALLDERMEHERALELLALIDEQHPEHTEQTNALLSDIEDSPLRRFLEMND